MNSVVGPKNTLVCVFLCFWLGREQCRETQPKNANAGLHAGNVQSKHTLKVYVPLEKKKNVNLFNRSLLCFYFAF